MVFYLNNNYYPIKGVVILFNLFMNYINQLIMNNLQR